MQDGDHFGEFVIEVGGTVQGLSLIESVRDCLDIAHEKVENNQRMIAWYPV